MFLLHTILIQHLFNKKKVRKFSYPPQSKCSTLSKCYSNQLEKSTRLLQDCFRGSTESLEMFVGRDRWSSSTPTPHSKQGKLQSWFRYTGPHWVTFGNLKGWRFSGQFPLGLSHHRTSALEYPMFALCSHWPFLIPCTYLKVHLLFCPVLTVE